MPEDMGLEVVCYPLSNSVAEAQDNICGITENIWDDVQNNRPRPESRCDRPQDDAQDIINIPELANEYSTNIENDLAL